MRAKAFAVVAVALVGAMAGTLVYAQAAEDPQIHACANLSTGALRAVDTAGACRAGERVLDWNVQGPQGLPGVTGPAGPQGAAGSSGAGVPGQILVGQLELTGYALPTQIRSFVFGATNSGSTEVGGGGGAGKVSFSDISISKLVDQSSPKLLLDLAQGKHIAEAKITVYQLGTKDPAAIYTLDDVLITSVQLDNAGAANAIPVEKVTLNFAKVKQQVLAGEGGGTACWDIPRNLTC